MNIFPDINETDVIDLGVNDIQAAVTTVEDTTGVFDDYMMHQEPYRFRRSHRSEQVLQRPCLLRCRTNLARRGRFAFSEQRRQALWQKKQSIDLLSGANHRYEILLHVRLRHHPFQRWHQNQPHCP